MLVHGKPHEAASKDQMRPVLTNVNLHTDDDGTKYLEATDSYVLVRIPVSDAEDDVDGLIPVAALKALDRREPRLTANSNVEVNTNEGIVTFEGRPQGQFPDAAALMEHATPGAFSFGINAKFLMKLSKALGDDVLVLSFADTPDGEPNPRRAVHVRPHTKGEGRGLIMPVRVSS